MWDLHDRMGEEITLASCQSLVESIRQHGQRQPVLGRPIADSDGNVIELIYGARRLFVARHLNAELLVEVRSMDDRSALIEMDIENRVRADISPYERGVSYRRWLRERFFASQAELAKCVGVSEAQVSRLLRFSELPAAVVSAFGSPRHIREEWALVLAKYCQDPKQRDTLIRRARTCASATRKLSPQRIFDHLSDKAGGNVKQRSRDEVVRDAAGVPILRVGVRGRTIHLIFTRQGITPFALNRITESVAEALKGSATSPPLVVAAQHAPR